MKCPLCQGFGLDPRCPPKDGTGLGTMTCPKCGGAGEVRSREYHLERELGSENMREVRGRVVPEIDTNPTAPPKVLRTKWDPPTVHRTWRWWADVVIRRLRAMVRVVDEALFVAEKRVQPRASPLKSNKDFDDVISGQCGKEIQDQLLKDGPLADGRWRDDYVERAREELDMYQMNPDLEARRVNTKRVCKTLMDRVRRSWLQMSPRNPEMLLRVVEAHNDELRKQGVRVPTHIQVDQLPGLEPTTFQVELVLDGYREAHIFTLGGDQCGS